MESELVSMRDAVQKMQEELQVLTRSLRKVLLQDTATRWGAGGLPPPPPVLVVGHTATNIKRYGRAAPPRTSGLQMDGGRAFRAAGIGPLRGKGRKGGRRRGGSKAAAGPLVAYVSAEVPAL